MDFDKSWAFIAGAIIGGLLMAISITISYPKLLPYGELTCVVEVDKILHCYVAETGGQGE